jgi:hypothetical protein
VKSSTVGAEVVVVSDMSGCECRAVVLFNAAGTRIDTLLRLKSRVVLDPF